MTGEEAPNGDVATGVYVPQTILITGGAGFIASHVAIRLVQNYGNYKVRRGHNFARAFGWYIRCDFEHSLTTPIGACIVHHAHYMYGKSDHVEFITFGPVGVVLIFVIVFFFCRSLCWISSITVPPSTISAPSRSISTLSSSRATSRALIS